MEAFKALFKRSSETTELDEASAEYKLRMRAWQDIYSQLSAVCQEEVAQGASKKKHKPISLPSEPHYLDLMRPSLSGHAFAYDHNTTLSRASGDITDFKTWHRCSFLCNDGIVYPPPPSPPLFVHSSPQFSPLVFHVTSFTDICTPLLSSLPLNLSQPSFYHQLESFDRPSSPAEQLVCKSLYV
jgi:hypothetical protein